MKHKLFGLLIFTGVFPLVLSVTRQYFLIKQGLTWNAAQTYCRANYTDLATITSNDEMTQLQKVAQIQLFFASAWIGLYTNINNWYWSFGNEPVVNFTAWYFLQPDNLYGDEFCVFIYLGKWYDAPCDWLLYFVCFDDRENATANYILIYKLKTWDNAQSYCRQYYTDLASGRNATENSIVGGFLFGATVWFGLNRERWRWSDQSTDVSSIDWWAGNSDDYLKNKGCGYLYGLLADEEQCSYTVMPFFCYLYPKQQQIMRLKVKSIQDLNDPAVMAAILEK
ncbi:putative C-type lectin domain family 20 member A isoform X1, partial [Clarias magur]